MKWLVGLDLRPSSQGAIRFASWLARNSNAPGHEAVACVHVLKEPFLQSVLRHHDLDDVLKHAEKEAARVVAEAGAADDMREIHIKQADCVETALEDARVECGADGLILGRQAKRASHDVIRLGKVCRKVLRSLEAPAIVVPPDLDAPDIGAGPVIALSKLSRDSESACHLAAKLAAALGRRLLVLHVVPTPEHYGAHYLPRETLAKLRSEHQQDGEQELSRWIAARKVGDCDAAVLQGSLVDEVTSHAAKVEACLIVCGSRGLSTAERMLLTSVGSTLAATASLPVAVVPTPAQGT
jgi:nucleotide-binding universal stress UspA family protein